ILSAKNFGCGSSREHAPQSLKRAGFKAVIAESFAEIFFGNSLTLGLACLTMDKADIQALNKQVEANPDKEISISLESMMAIFNGVSYKFTVPKIAREALLKGSYDLLAELLRNKAKVDSITLPY
ncbi:MAG: isopropylmalate isomerase, partial [Deferribacteraceae bacterium]|nr:isopropylmalate isomerase [Deferribacteraceae bacterium]